ncbi:MAG: SRPBCC domain-containing protein [Phycisphaerales bacterium]|nr:SRPBCC domain-containing protein [Phycisphaerales bacterium]
MFARLSAAVSLGFIFAFCPAAVAQPESAPGNRTLEWNAEIDAPLAQVWDAFTTEDGIESWMTPLAEVDLRIGGSIKTNYNPQGTIGDETTIVHRILSLEPQRMLSSRVEKSPSGFPHAKVLEQAWGVWYFEPLGANRTHIRLVSAGWGSGSDWDAAETFFQAGNEWTLNQLKEKFAAAAGNAASPDATLDIARRLLGGEWIASQPNESGETFRVRNTFIDGPDGRSFSVRGWVGGDDGMFEHGQGQIWIEPGQNEVRFQNINEQGHVARGAITSPKADTLEWDWHARADAGPGQRYRVTMHFTGPDAYTFRLEHLEENGSYRQLIELPFTRVRESSEAREKPAPGGGR